MRRVSVLGSTGSIGESTLDVLRRHGDRYRVHALAANRSVDALLAQCIEFRPTLAVMMDADAASELAARLPADGVTRVEHGEAALAEAAAGEQVDVVMAAIVGAAGLPSTLAAARAGKTVLLANKESLVMAGHLLMQAVQDSGGTLLPIDSEHNAIFQCLPVDSTGKPGKRGVSRVLLTASGGPFRNWTMEQMRAASPAQACAHPNWDMGRKISVDSATLMNKGLEFIEACWLFDLVPQQVDVVVHPQSIIHSMVQYVDGSVLAQLGNPDMRTPIAYGLEATLERVTAVEPTDLSVVELADTMARECAAGQLADMRPSLRPAEQH